MLIFRSEEQVDEWCSGRELSRGALLEPRTAWELARAWYQNKLKPDWRRHTLEETEELFARLGLVGEFWNLRPR